MVPPRPRITWREHGCDTYLGVVGTVTLFSLNHTPRGDAWVLAPFLPGPGKPIATQDVATREKAERLAEDMLEQFLGFLGWAPGRRQPLVGPAPDPDTPTGRLRSDPAKSGKEGYQPVVCYQGRIYTGCGHTRHTELRPAAQCADRMVGRFSTALRRGTIDADGAVWRDGAPVFTPEPPEEQTS